MAAKKSANRDAQVTWRHALLAALGAVAVVRREARTAAEIAVEEGVKLGGRIEVFAEDARLIARGGVITLREKSAPALRKLRAEVQARMAPWFDAFATPTKTASDGSRTPRATKKTTHRGGAARKTAERTRARSQR